jgi:hypothetical protein
MFTLALCLVLTTAYAQPDKEVVSDTVEISVGNKVLSIITDSSSNGKQVHFGGKKSSEGNPDFEMRNGDGDDDYADGDGNGDRKKKRKKVKVELINIDLGAQFLTFDQSFDIPVEYNAYDIKPLNSTSLDLHLFKTKVRMLKGHVNLITAFTFENNRFSFRENTTLVPGRDSLLAIVDSIPLSGGYRKHKLIAWYGQIPLLIKFETNPYEKKKNFHFAVGGYAGLLLSAHTKKKFNNGDKTKVNDDYNLEPFHYGAMARIGFRGIDFYAKYELSNLFRENQGPAFHPFTFGISLTGAM